MFFLKFPLFTGRFFGFSYTFCSIPVNVGYCIRLLSMLLASFPKLDLKNTPPPFSVRLQKNYTENLRAQGLPLIALSSWKHIGGKFLFSSLKTVLTFFPVKRWVKVEDSYLFPAKKDFNLCFSLPHSWFFFSESTPKTLRGSAFPASSIGGEAMCLWDDDKRLAICGDFCVSPGVEGAVLSGMRAASKLSGLLSCLWSHWLL